MSTRMAPTRVGIVGGSGETGTSIVNGLLAAGGYSIVALTRPASMDKLVNIGLKDSGIELRSLDLLGPQEAIVSALKDIEILISAIGPFEQLSQIPLATAAKEAGVKRFFPCAFITSMPVGIHMLRDQKEEVYNHVKRLRLSYTIVDVGWWYQISFPALPSGKIDYAMSITGQRIPGDGGMPSAITDLRDIGPYVERCIKDERTKDKYVLAYNEMWSKTQVYDLVEELSGENLEREYVSAEDLEAQITDANKKLMSNPDDGGMTALQRISAEYIRSFGVRGDNTPEYAHFLGYVTSKDLWPDMSYIKFEDYMKEVIDGKAKGVYEHMAEWIQEALKKARVVAS